MAARHADERRIATSVRLKPDLLRAVDELAAAERRSRSEMIEMAVEELVSRMSKKPKAK